LEAKCADSDGLDLWIGLMQPSVEGKDQRSAWVYSDLHDPSRAPFIPVLADFYWYKSCWGVKFSREALFLNTHSVCAVIVTYHPASDMVANMFTVRAQVQGMVVVDNGSNPEELSPLRQAASELSFQLIENSENLGIAEGLNRGVKWAKEQGYSWVILFDQDSKITEGFLDAMFATWESHQHREKIASLHPRYVEPVTNIGPVIKRAADGGPFVSITSGALMPTWIFDRIGYFASEYFIDEVDTEYCLRMRAAGYYVADSRQAVLLHVIGHPRYAFLLGFRFRPSHHNAIRRYYMSRNRIALLRKYFTVFPAWAPKFIYEAMKDTVKALIAEEDRSRKFRNLFLGTWDGFTGRMGKRTGI
jgi:rhamnosyltransferase